MDFLWSQCFPGPGVSIARCWVSMAVVRVVSGGGGGVFDTDVLCWRRMCV